MTAAKRQKQIAKSNRSGPRSAAGSATAILEITSDAWVVLDREWCHTYVNPAAERIAGLRREEMLGRTIQEVSPERAPTVEAACRRALEQGTVVHFEEYYSALNTWFEHTVYPSTDAFTVYAREVTERKRTEAALRESEERLRMEEELRAKERFIRQVAELTPVLLSVFDVERERDTYISPDVINVVGYTRDEIAQMSDPFALWHPIARAKEYLARCKRAADGEINELEYRVRHRNGNWRWLATRSIPFARNEKGELWQIVTATLDVTEHKQADERVRRSEEHWRSLIENASDIISILQTDGTMRYESPSVKRILGYDAEELIGKNAFDFVHPDDVPQMVQGFTRTLEHKSEATENLSCRFRHKNGSWRVLEGIGKLFVDESGELVALFNSRDVTERKTAQEAFRASQERLRLLIESAEDYAILTLDAEGRVSSWSSGAVRMFGYAEGEIIGRSGEILFTPEDRERDVPLEEMKQAREKGRASEDRFYLRKDRTRVFASGVTALLRDHGGQRGYVKIARDLTERKRAEDALRRAHDVLEQRVVERTQQLTALNKELRRSESYLAEGQRLSHTGSGAWNVSTGEVFWSEETYRIYGFEPGTVKPSSEVFFGLVHPDERLPLEQAFDRVVRERADYELEFRIVRPDGATRNVHSVGRPIFNDSGHLTEVIGTVMDVTERNRSEERLRAAQAELAHMARVTTMGELAASIAHELSQPLAAVTTNASACFRWLEGAQPNLDEARQSLTRIVREGHRAGNVIQRIRSLLAKERQQMSLVDLNEVIREVLALITYEISRTDVLLQTELDNALPTINGDRVQLQQVILNLVMNATEATAANPGEASPILVTSETHGPNDVVISIRDSGGGIDLKNVDQLFTPFFSTKPGGLGMGLSISRSIIEAHGGRLWAVANEAAGATFRFSLPSCTTN
jgi:PAS domain S-box-containing protein